jgi:hypothetical protein
MVLPTVRPLPLYRSAIHPDLSDLYTAVRDFVDTQRTTCYIYAENLCHRPEVALTKGSLAKRPPSASV